MKQKKEKAETAKAIFSKENLGFINEPESKEMAEQRLLALSNAVESQYIYVGSNAYDGNWCKDGESACSVVGERRIACCCLANLKPYNLSFQQVLLAYLVPLNQASSSYHLLLPAAI